MMTVCLQSVFIFNYFSTVLRVSFDPQVSFYVEGQPGNLRVTMNHVIAQDFSVDVNGCKSHDLDFLLYIKLASGPQLRVKNNGPTINRRVMYTARGARTLNIPFNVGDDLLAREDIESYQVALSNPSDAMVILGTSATINISDSDCKWLLIKYLS